MWALNLPNWIGKFAVPHHDIKSELSPLSALVWGAIVCYVSLPTAVFSFSELLLKVAFSGPSGNYSSFNQLSPD